MGKKGVQFFAATSMLSKSKYRMMGVVTSINVDLIVSFNEVFNEVYNTMKDN